MLTRLKLRNFKSWTDTGDIELRPITGFFGANSSGKTSLFQALLLLMQTAHSSDYGAVFSFGDSESPANLGDFLSTVHGHSRDAEMEISLDWRTDRRFSLPISVTQMNPFLAVGFGTELGFTTTTSLPSLATQPNPTMNTMSYRVGDAVFGVRSHFIEGSSEPTLVERLSTVSGMRRNERSRYDLFSKGTTFKFKKKPNASLFMSTSTKCYKFPNEIREDYQDVEFLFEFEQALETALKNISYVGPLRAHPKREYAWDRKEPTKIWQEGNSAVAAVLTAREHGSYLSLRPEDQRRSLEAYIAYWLRKLKLMHDFRIDRINNDNNIYQVKIRQAKETCEVSIADVGFGVSQILPILTLCFYAPEGSTIILEQPEIHLHPAIQFQLADILIEAWKTRKVQILFESHSEYLLQRLRRRIAEETLSEGETGLFFCRSEGQRSAIEELNLDAYGNISNWPEDFFGDEFGEIAAAAKAQHIRRIEEKK